MNDWENKQVVPRKRWRNRKSARSALLLVAVLSLVSGCTNVISKSGGLGSSLGSGSSSLTTTGTATLTTTTPVSHVLINAQVSASPSNGNLTLALAVNTSLPGYLPLTQFCATSGANVCMCELDWNQLNAVGSSATTVARTKRLTVTQVQAASVQCALPTSFWTTLASGTQMSMTIVPIVQSGNLTALNVQAINYKKNSTANNSGSGGDFTDSLLTPFYNIQRYTCFRTDHFSPYEVLSAAWTLPAGNTTTTPTPPPVTEMVGNAFCVSPNSTANGSYTCQTPRNGLSAQNYFRNLYVPSYVAGSMNTQNTNYYCPLVKEPILYSAGSVPSSGLTPSVWPLDTSFALAQTPNNNWSVGVTAASTVSKSGDPAPSPCQGDKLSMVETGINRTCLGYAAPPKSDGTCGTMTDNTGKVRPLVRLRRYRAIFPAQFDFVGNGGGGGTVLGAPVQSPTAIDEILVADRLVVDSNGVATGDMIYGPKPCNFAWFDHEGVTNRTGAGNFFSHFVGGVPIYKGTNSFYYTDINGNQISVNPDGLILPNADSIYQNVNNAILPPSCSATVPLVQQQVGSPSLVRLITLNNNRTDHITLGTRVFFLNEQHLRPIDPWVPNYLEDTTFQACAPLADPFTEPPLHVYQGSSGTMSWCSKPYPTQNPYWFYLNQKRATVNAVDNASVLVNWGLGSAPVKHYTSYVNASSTSTLGTLTLTDVGLINPNSSSTLCKGTLSVCSDSGQASSACRNYIGESGTRLTCDRTVKYDTALLNSNPTYPYFPLQAPTSDIVNMLATDDTHDKGYACTYSVSSDSSKINTQSPSSGCCGVINGVPLLQHVLGTAGNHGHLEPFQNANFPSVRFCGNPVK